jgi:hypothetical protein
MAFLSDLASSISSTFNVGENNTHSLDSVIAGQQTQYGSLGAFASQIDQSAQRSYVEEGYLRTDPYNAEPKQREILFQQPSATILIKKRMFSSIAENFRPDYMDQDEKLYYRAIKFLFQNKCNVISALEKLSKIQQVTSAVGTISDQLVPIVMSLSDTLTAAGTGSLFGAFTSNSFGGSQDVSQLASVMDQLRKIYGYNTTNFSTTWITDSSDMFQSQLGAGTGVIEITNFTSFNTNVAVNGIANPGGFSLNISDPYESMLITEWDIEKAISDATNMFYSDQTFNLGQQSIDQVIASGEAQLNSLRYSRGASTISFVIDPDTLLGQRVTAILDNLGKELVFTYNSGLLGIGSSVSVADYYLYGNGLGTNGLSSNELSIFQNVVSSIYSKIELDANSRNSFQIANQQTNYARRKMRFNFLGQLIIQPMDIIHFYINSKSSYDSKLLSGLQSMFSGAGILQNLNTMVTNLTTSLGSLLNPEQSIMLQIEKSAFVGSDFPNYLWNMLRSQFVTENEGTHVFSGIVTEANDNWSNGAFTISVTGKDNTYYFDQGKINFKPGVDVSNGLMFDPLTPFKTSFDTITSTSKAQTPVLLDENQAILGTSQDKTGLLKAKAGPNAGQNVTSDSFLRGQVVNGNTGQVSNEIFAPDGLVYKWKEGIGVFTQFGDSDQLNDANLTGGTNIFKNPFAGQDVMNVISLLITGQPYNYATFWKATASNGGYNNDPQSKSDAAHSFMSSLTSSLTKNNIMWGNFIPFKELIVSGQDFAKSATSETRIGSKNDALIAKINQYKALQSLNSIFSVDNTQGFPSAIGTAVSNGNLPSTTNISAQMTALATSIQADIAKLQAQDNSFTQNSPSQFGSYSSGPSLIDIQNGTNPVQPTAQDLLRKETGFLTRRMSYNVRSNEDKNLFIVDDSYDKDYDILAFEQSLSDVSIYTNEYLSVRDQIRSVAELLDLEVFADTQGHIRVRPPQYNKMPSSVFYRMLYMKQAYGIQVFPQFLTDLFGNQIRTLTEQLEVLEDMIRLDGAIIGYSDDTSLTQFIQNSTAATTPFAFISDPTSRTVVDFTTLIQSTATDPGTLSPQSLTSGLSGSAAASLAANSGMNAFAQRQGVATQETVLEQQAQGTANPFTDTAKYTAIVQQVINQKTNAQGFSVDASSLATETYVQLLINEIFVKSGVKINQADFIAPNPFGQYDVSIPSSQQVDVVKVTNDLQEKINQRQMLIKTLYSTLKNALEYKSLDNPLGNQFLPPPSYGNSNVPEVFQSLIEDETYDDYGPGSGTRYIIRRPQIRNISIHAGEPDYTMVDVKGFFSPVIGNEGLPDQFNSFPSGGNALVTATAVDYDAWRNYGFKQSAPITAPFLSDPVTQCGPYASIVLSRNRKNMIKGSVTISGNEYLQPGDVVFLEDRQMLFYVHSVSHEFTYGRSFTTKLELTYGHTAGDFIPTILDAAGKMIYNNRDNGSFIVNRQTNTNNEADLGVLILDPNGNNETALPADGTNQSFSPIGTWNSKVLNNIIFYAAYKINANNTAGNNITANIELRYYFDNNNAVNPNLQSFVSSIQGILTGSSGGLTIPSFSSIQNQPFNPANIIPVSINLSPATEPSKADRRSPSQRAWDAARNQANGNSYGAGTAAGIASSSLNTFAPTVSTDQISQALYGYVVDCWLVLTENTSAANTTSTSQSLGTTAINANSIPSDPSNAAQEISNVYGGS